MEKYVNMADIINQQSSSAETVTLIELLFFAYRDFVSDPDALLEELAFGRAHHRVLHFVGRNPGMTVAQLLDILKITKQSLSRVLKELLARQLVFQQEGQQDRRQRLLYLTDAGAKLHQQLMAPQIERIERAIQAHAGTAGDGSAAMRQIMLGLVSPKNRVEVLDWINRAAAARSATDQPAEDGEHHG